MFNELRFQAARDEEPGEANSADPEARRPAERQHGADDRTQQLQPARDDDQALADRRHADVAPRRAQIQGRLRLPVRRHPQPIPRLLQRLVHVPIAGVVRRRPAQWRQRVRTSRTSPATARPGRTPTRTSRSTRSSSRTSGARSPMSRVNLGLRYDLMKTAAPPVRNPDAQLAAAGIDTSRLDTDGNNFGPRLRRRLGAAGQEVRRPRRVRRVLRPHAVDHARHGALEQRHQHRRADVHRRCRADLAEQLRLRFPTGGVPAKPTIFYIQPDFQNARLMQGNLAAEWEILPDTSLTVTYLSGAAAICRARSTATRLARLTQLHRCRHRRE